MKKKLTKNIKGQVPAGITFYMISNLGNPSDFASVRKIWNGFCGKINTFTRFYAKLFQKCGKK